MAIKLDELAGPDGGNESTRLAKYWLDQIASVKDNSEHKRWIKRGETIEKRYRDERNRSDEEGQRRYNSLWSNVEILRPALYGKIPLPVAERRFKDKDPTGRNAAQILERALRNEIEICGYDEALQAAVSDYLLPGRGVVWVRYEPEIEEGISLPPEPQLDMRDSEGEIEDGEQTPRRRVRRKLEENEPETEPEPEEQPEEIEAEDEEKLMSTGDRIIRESTQIDFIPWTDFFTFPVRARNWKEVTALAKRVFMSRKQLTDRFGSTIGKKIPLIKDARGDRQQNTLLQSSDQDKAQVFEIWSKEDETIYWVAEGYSYLCDRKDDELKLEYFFPCPRPLYANPTTNTLIPVPDYIQYQDQAIQIDELTQRIAMLTKACKMAGVYNAAADGIKRLFDESIENELIPVDDWAAFGNEKGGVEGNMSLLPVKDIIGILNELMMVKQKQIEEMDRLTGINDIMRGTSDARETLGGVRIKSNTTGTRLTSRQNEVARFARDTLRIMADIMSQHFSPQSLIDVSGALYEEGLGPEDMPTLSALQGPPPSPQGQAPAGQGAPGRALTVPPQPLPGGPPGPPMASGPMGAPPPQIGQNVVPFRGPVPPAAPPGQSGMPPGAPPQPMGTGPMGLPPELKAKIDALQRIAKAITLLRNERLRGFRVDIEVESTIYGDQAQDKQDRTQFVVAVTQYLQQAMMLGSQMPEIIPLLGKMLQFAARGHRIGRDLELAIEQFSDEAGPLAKMRMAQAAANNPEAQKAQLEIQKIQSQLGIQQIQAVSERNKAQAEIQSTQMKSQTEQQQAQAEVQRQQYENSGDMIRAQADQAQAQADAQMQQLQMQIELIKLKIEYAKLGQSQHQTQMAQHQTASDATMAQETTQQEREHTLQEQERTKQASLRPPPTTAQPQRERTK